MASGKLLSTGASVALAGALSLGIASGVAFADGTSSQSAPNTAQSQQTTASSFENLPDGTYQVPVAAYNAKDPSKKSMMNAAVNSVPAQLTVKKGVYTLSLTVKQMTVKDITAGVSEVGLFENYVYNAQQYVKPNGATKQLFKEQTPTQNGSDAPISFTLTDAMKKSRAVALSLTIPFHNNSTEVVVLKLDTSKFDANAQKAAEEAKQKEALAKQQEEQAKQAQQQAESEQAQAAQDAQEASDEQTVDGLIVGASYKVPLHFYKYKASGDSMSGKFFGDYAVAIPQADGTCELRFSTNRPDFLTRVAYKGRTAKVLRESSTSREYSITIPATNKEFVATLAFTVVPMNHMTVEADMHVYMNRAELIKKGASAHASSTYTGSVGKDGMPKTGDMAVVAGFAGLTGSAAIIAAVAVARRRFER